MWGEQPREGVPGSAGRVAEEMVGLGGGGHGMDWRWERRGKQKKRE